MRSRLTAFLSPWVNLPVPSSTKVRFVLRPTEEDSNSANLSLTTTSGNRPKESRYEESSARGGRALGQFYLSDSGKPLNSVIDFRAMDGTPREARTASISKLVLQNRNQILLYKTWSRERLPR